MLALKRWRPLLELSTLHRDIDDFFKRTFETMSGLTTVRGEWQPSVESFVRGKDLILRAEIPGVEIKDVDISIVGNMLTIRGEKRAEKEVKEVDYTICEMCYGSFERAVTLPEGVKTDDIHASYKNGILEIKIPAERAELPKKITIEVEGGKEERAKKAA